jgi:hypothetical protein
MPYHLPPAENRVTFDEVEATADFENQLGPLLAGLVTQTQGDAPTAGYRLGVAHFSMLQALKSLIFSYSLFCVLILIPP